MKTDKRLISLCQLIVILAFLVISCNKDEPAPPVSITEFSPTSGIAGTPVVITGNNFSKDPAKNAVYFNGTSAEVSQASTTSLTVTVPDNATTGKIAVTVHGKTALSDADFIVFKPSITGFAPTKGLTGASVIITGMDFNPDPPENRVAFNGVTAEVTQATATSLTVTVPEGATTGKISVTVHGKTVTSDADFIVLDPSITGFSPIEGAVGTTVTITGVNFSPEPSENVVQFNGVNAEVSQASTTSLTVIVPELATTGKISVTVYGKTVLSEARFVIPLPAITSLNPAFGTAGIPITINGSYFSPVISQNIVKFSGTEAVVTEASPTHLKVIVPAGATTGKVSVKVGLATTTSIGNFTICNGKAELVFSEVSFSDIEPTKYNVSIELFNVGSEPIDLKTMTVQHHISADNIYGNGDSPSGGFELTDGVVLANGEKQRFTYTRNFSQLSEYPYLVIQIKDSGIQTPECSKTNNIIVAKVE